MVTALIGQNVDKINKSPNFGTTLSSEYPNMTTSCRCSHTNCCCFRMIYVSRIRFFAALQPDVFSEILHLTRLNNHKDGVDSVLLFANGLFFQYLEGSEESLTNLKNRLLMDKRHKHLKLLSFTNISKRRLSDSPLWFVWLDKDELKKMMHTLSLTFNPYEWTEAEQLKMTDALITSKQQYQAQSLTSLIQIRLNFLLMGSSVSKTQHKLHYLLFSAITIFFWIVLLLCVYLYILV